MGCLKLHSISPRQMKEFDKDCNNNSDDDEIGNETLTE